MPPKKKGAGKKPTKEKTPVLINGLTKEEMSKEQLEEYIMRVREDLDREREERNYFQLERDMIQSFWKVPERKLAEVQAKVKNLEKEIEDDEMNHQVEVKVYKQKMKHLLFEHQNTVCELEAGGAASTEAAHKDQETLEKDLHQEMRELLVNTQQVHYETLVEELKMKHQEDMTATRTQWEEYFTEFAEKTKKKMQLMQQEQENTRETAVSDRQQQWNAHINTLRDDTDKAFQIKPSAIREKKMDITRTMTNINENKKVQDCKRTELRAILHGNRSFAENVSGEEHKQLAGVQKRINYYSEKTDTLEQMKMKKLKTQRREEEELQEKFNQLQLEKDGIQQEFGETVEKVQQQQDADILKLEKEVQALMESTEETQTRLSSVLSAPNLDHTALKVVTGQALALAHIHL